VWQHIFLVVAAYSFVGVTTLLYMTHVNSKSINKLVFNSGAHAKKEVQDIKIIR
jgi:hypothetical protein